jgi:hypothetical protein
MQVIQGWHNGLIIFLLSSFIITHLYTRIEREINQQHLDEDDRGAMQDIQDQHNGLNYILFVVFSSLLTCIPRKGN